MDAVKDFIFSQFVAWLVRQLWINLQGLGGPIIWLTVCGPWQNTLLLKGSLVIPIRSSSTLTPRARPSTYRDAKPKYFVNENEAE